MATKKKAAKQSKRFAKLTPEHAALIIDAHDIKDACRAGEERRLMKSNNPELLEAYEALIEFSELVMSK